MARLKAILRALLPAPLRSALTGWRRRRQLSWGDLRRLEPVSRAFGSDRGRPIDRWYIEDFLRRQAADVRGVVLEIADNAYTRQFGGARVAASEVLHSTAGNPAATLIGNLETGAGIPAGRFDCLILTQTLPFIYEARAALAVCREALAPGGVLLATLPGICQISRYDRDRWGDYWRFTPQSAERLFAATFGPSNVSVMTYGNVLAATAFLQGLAIEDLRPDEIEACDPDYPMVIGVRAMKPPAPSC